MIDISYPDGRKMNLINELRGIQESRRWIANYVIESVEELPLQDVDDATIFQTTV